MHRWSVLLLVLLLSGCALFRPDERPVSPLTLPQAWSRSFSAGETPGTWWHAFNSDELNRLVTTALAQNLDIRIARARLLQARATGAKAFAATLPTLGASAGYDDIRSRTQEEEDARGKRNQAEKYSLGLSAAWEMDLWGRLYSQRRARDYSAEAARKDLEAAAQTVAATVMESWTNILAVRQETELLKTQIAANETLLSLQNLRFSNGQASALDVAQQRESLASSRAALPLLQQKERLYLNSLALLLGTAAPDDIRIRQQELPPSIPLPAEGLPADLLIARPDVRAAWLRLSSADWDTAAARADRLPAISLSASRLFSSGRFDLLFENWVTTLAADLTAPLFDGGRRKAEVERTRAIAEENLALYTRTVAEAIREVEDALVTEASQKAYIARLEEQLAATRLSLENARLQYRNGRSDYLAYLAAWNGVQQLERQLVNERASLIKNRIALYLALGGDWNRDAPTE